MVRNCRRVLAWTVPRLVEFHRDAPPCLRSNGPKRQRTLFEDWAVRKKKRKKKKKKKKRNEIIKMEMIIKKKRVEAV